MVDLEKGRFIFPGFSARAKRVECRCNNEPRKDREKSAGGPQLKKLPQNLQDWIEARRRHRLSHAQVQMARELGMNPRKLGKLDNRDQEPWKLPLPQLIESLYARRFGRERPEAVMSIEERSRLQAAKKAARREAGRRARGAPG